MESLHNETVNGYQINIYHDTDCESPLEYMGDIVNVAAFHRRYSLGNYDTKGVDPEELEKELRRERAEYSALYMYDHGGIALKLTPFSCRWDSGQLGWVWIDAENGRKEWGRKWRQKARKFMTAVVETYSKWVNGECYGYEILDSEGNDVDSCWGFIGLDNAIEAAKENLPQNLAETALHCAVCVPFAGYALTMVGGFFNFQTTF